MFLFKSYVHPKLIDAISLDMDSGRNLGSGDFSIPFCLTANFQKLFSRSATEPGDQLLITFQAVQSHY